MNEVVWDMGKIHKWLFGFDAEVQIYGWSWTYWYDISKEESPCGGGYRAVTDGIFCFQRRYTV